MNTQVQKEKGTPSWGALLRGLETQLQGQKRFAKQGEPVLFANPLPAALYRGALARVRFAAKRTPPEPLALACLDAAIARVRAGHLTWEGCP